jgi:anion-transporting  ArsA/GET3 family ATPase
VEPLLEGKGVVICAGAGGVGKTTTSAAIALGMAAQGLKVAVLTIDPARRLAQSLGLKELGNEARRIEGLEVDGELWAMMLDAKRTFDELVERHAPDEAARDAILRNRIYGEISNAVAGSQEYMAMEKLYELREEGKYDLLVLDTPPSRNALDFLDAPERLSRFIDSRSLRFFLAPGMQGLKLFSRGTGMLLSVLKRVTGTELLQDLSEFFNAFGGMAEGFRQRAVRVSELLSDPDTAFLLVTSTRSDAVDEAIFFNERLRSADMSLGGVIVNRVHMEVQTAESGASLRDDLDPLLGPDLGAKVARNYDDFRLLAEHDRASIERLRKRLRSPLVLVPHLEDDVHDASGLEAMNRHLFATDPVSASP